MRTVLLQLVPWVIPPLLVRYSDLVEWYCRFVGINEELFWGFAIVATLASAALEFFSWLSPEPISYKDDVLTIRRRFLWFTRTDNFRLVGGSWCDDSGQTHYEPSWHHFALMQSRNEAFK